MQPHALIVVQRQHLADQLSRLAEGEWDSPTLCEGWTVRHVVAHLLMPLRYSRMTFAIGMLRARGDFNRFADRIARRDAMVPPAELLHALRENAEDPYQPPGGGHEGALTDLVVHSLDITRPLGVPSGIDPAAVTLALDQLIGPASVKFFDLRLDGLRLRATDLDWSHGKGREVAGPAEDLVMGLARRRTPLTLDGDGASALHEMAHT